MMLIRLEDWWEVGGIQSWIANSRFGVGVTTGALFGD